MNTKSTASATVICSIYSNGTYAYYDFGRFAFQVGLGKKFFEDIDIFYDFDATIVPLQLISEGIEIPVELYERLIYEYQVKWEEELPYFVIEFGESKRHKKAIPSHITTSPALF